MTLAVPFPDDGEPASEPSAVVVPRFETRFARFTAEEYFAEPCSMPALSASIAQVLDTQSPLHAWSRHPKFGGVSRPPTKALDNGSLSHALLLGTGKEIEVVDAKNWTTNAAKALRDAAREAGKLPVLAEDYAEAKKTADILRQRFADLGIALDGESEATALWTETTRGGAKVQCRGMLDHKKLPVIYDIKSIRSADLGTCQRHIDTYGYAIQRAAYVSAIERIRPDLAGRVDFIFVFYELAAPHAVTPVRLSGAFRALGERKWRAAVERWERCLRTNQWPAYADEIVEIEPPPWALTRDMDKQLAAIGHGEDLMADDDTKGAMQG